MTIIIKQNKGQAYFECIEGGSNITYGKVKAVCEGVEKLIKLRIDTGGSTSKFVVFDGRNKYGITMRCNKTKTSQEELCDLLNEEVYYVINAAVEADTCEKTGNLLIGNIRDDR